MVLMRRPLADTDELASERPILAVTSHPAHIAPTARCPHGHRHAHRGRSRWEQAHRTAASRQARTLLDA